MSNGVLDRSIIGVVRTAWTSILERRSPRADDPLKPPRFTDNESDVGILKDVDALNALVEPFLVSPKSFDDPAIDIQELEAYLLAIAQEISLAAGSLAGEGAEPKPKHDPIFRGFEATPYPYIQLPLDFVDSAAGVLRLLCNFTHLCEVRRRQIPRGVVTTLSTLATSAVDFLIEAAVEDSNGVRWQGVAKKTEPPGRYANLFFTNVASLALKGAITRPEVSRWLGVDRKDAIDRLLSLVPQWVLGQYDRALKTFWMDAGRATNQAVGALYALEMLYIFLEDASDPYPSCCSEALSSIVARMQTLADSSTLQMDFFHVLPLPTSGNVFYDDRRYIGAYLSLFALAQRVDPDVLTEDLILAGSVLLGGVLVEWVDESSGLWDDGRPLICYSQDALLGLVNYGTGGIVPVVSLREDVLRNAIREALASNDAVDIVLDAIRKVHKRQEDNALAGKFRKASVD